MSSVRLRNEANITLQDLFEIMDVKDEAIMDTEEMNLSELLKEVAEENQTRKILEILEKCKTLDEAKTKIKELLKK